MIEYVVLVLQLLNLIVLLGVLNEIMDIGDYLFFKEVVMDDKDNL